LPGALLFVTSQLRSGEGNVKAAPRELETTIGDVAKKQIEILERVAPRS
jgi:hypothetical protein